MPEEVTSLAESVLNQPEVVRIDQETMAVTVSHSLYPVNGGNKTDLLLRLLHHTDTRSVLVFTQTRHLARRLAANLEKAGHKATSLQADLTQSGRKAALDGFRDGTYKVLVTHRHRGARHRRVDHLARDQLRHAGDGGGLRSPHRAHGARLSRGQGVLPGDPRRSGDGAGNRDDPGVEDRVLRSAGPPGLPRPERPARTSGRRGKAGGTR